MLTPRTTNGIWSLLAGWDRKAKVFQSYALMRFHHWCETGHQEQPAVDIGHSAIGLRKKGSKAGICCCWSWMTSVMGTTGKLHHQAAVPWLVAKQNQAAGKRIVERWQIYFRTWGFSQPCSFRSPAKKEKARWKASCLPSVKGEL